MTKIALLFTEFLLNRHGALSNKEIAEITQKSCAVILNYLNRSVFRGHERTIQEITNARDKIIACFNELERATPRSHVRALLVHSWEISDPGAGDGQVAIYYLQLDDDCLSKACPLLLIRTVIAMMNTSSTYLKYKVTDASQLRTVSVHQTAIEEVIYSLRRIIRHIRGTVCQHCSIGELILHYEVNDNIDVTIEVKA